MTVNARPFAPKGGKERWEVDIRFHWPDGTVFRERKVAPGTSRSAAQRWGETRERDLLVMGKELYERQKNGEPEETEPPREVPTLEVFFERYMVDHCKGNGLAPATLELYSQEFKAYLKPKLGALRLDEITDAEVDALKASLSDRAPKTVNNALGLLNNMLNRAKAWKVIAYKPCDVKKRREPKKDAEFLDFDVFEKLVAAAKQMEPRVHIAVLLGGRAGMRRGEILALRWANVDFKRNVLKVVESDWKGIVKPPKNGKAREVPMTNEVREALLMHHARALQSKATSKATSKAKAKAVTLDEAMNTTGETGNDRVLQRDDGSPARSDLLRSWLMRAEKAAGIEARGRAHRLRHTLLSHLALRGAPLRTIQEVAGHHALSMTARYLHLSPSAKSDAMSLVDGFSPSASPATNARAPSSPPEFGDSLETGEN